MSHSGRSFLYENWEAISPLNGLPVVYVSAGLENTLKG